MFQIFLLLVEYQLVAANMRTHDFKMTYDNINELVVMTCKVPKDQWFSVGFGVDMNGAGAIVFQGKGSNGVV